MQKTSSSKRLNKKIEGLLDALFFATTRPVSLTSIMRLLEIKDKNTAREIMTQYIRNFKNKMHGVKIVKRGEYFFPKIDEKYIDKISGYLHPPPLTTKQLEVLAYIYVKKKVKMSELSNIFGSRVYRDIKKFIRLGLVSKKKTEQGYLVEIRKEAEPLILRRRKRIKK